VPRSRRLVVGLGNPLVADDAFGCDVVTELRGSGRWPDVDIVDAGTDLLTHIETFESYDEVILVDTVLDPARAGQVATLEQDVFLGWPDSSPNCHAISPLDAVKLFRALHPAAPTRFTLVALFTDRVSGALADPL
jgi:hydrogenase maturation protease